MELQPVRGTRDFYPEDLLRRTWLFGHFRETARLFNFHEYDAPVLETEELYIRKAGEEITGQLYNFEDKGGRRVALRPEMTPSLARLVLQKGRSLSLPLKWFSIPQCWRYERTTRGRKREHYQWNMDIIGIPDVTAEVELLTVIATFFERVGITSDDVVLRVSSRKVLQGVLEELGVSDAHFAPVCVLVDKLEKMPREAIESDMRELGLTDAMVDRIVETLSLRSLDGLESVLGADHAALAELRRLFELGDQYGIGDWLQFDASIVRGLAYYTGTVFEAFDKNISLRAICGGGRYDHLLSTFGGSDIPMVGFGFGDVVIMELLSDLGRLPDLKSAVDDVVFPFDEALRGAAYRVADRLRAAGRSVDVVLEPKKLKWVLKHADRLGASRVLFVAPDEWAQGRVNVRDVAGGEERRIPLEDL